MHMKIYSYLLCGIIGLVVLTSNAMEIAQKEKTTLAQNKKLFTEFDKIKFADKGSANNKFIKTPFGRAHLLMIRVAEKQPCNTILNEWNSEADPPSNTRFVASSLIYGREAFAYAFEEQDLYPSTDNILPLSVLNEVIVEEEFFLEKCNATLSDHEKELYEDTRIKDLYVLAKILEYDNNEHIQAACPYEFLERLAYTHKEWPPEGDKSYFPLSGYTIIERVLKRRKEQKIDELDQSNLRECWTHEIVPPEGVEKE